MEFCKTNMNAVGYPVISRFIARDPDQETFVFRKFDELTARNLLNLQGELIDLESRLATLDDEVKSSTDPYLRSSMRSWRIMKETAERAVGESKEKAQQRIDFGKELDMKLEKYHKALIRSGRMAKLEAPSNRVLSAYRCVLVYNLDDIEKASVSGASDLAALKPPFDNDVLSRTLRNHWPLPSKSYPTGESSNITHFEEKRLVQVISVISFMISALLIIGPILALNFITRAEARLGITIAFIVIFALGLSLSTGVSRDNVFVATATYSAVLVVFVSGSLTGSLDQPSSVFEGQTNTTLVS
ncbi:hypothetical protein MBLNU13_g10824t1 [Cladosporium sp. NU13]